MSEPTKLEVNIADAQLASPRVVLEQNIISETTTSENMETTSPKTEKTNETIPVKKIKIVRTARKSTSGLKKNTIVNMKKKNATPKKSLSKEDSKTKPIHPPFIEMITEAIEKLNDRSGSSRQAILKYIVANYKVQEKSGNQHVKVVLKNAVKAGSLKQVKGVGASGSFKLSESLKSKTKTKEKIQKKSARKASTPVKKPIAKKVNGPVKIKKIASKLASFSTTVKTKPINSNAKKTQAKKIVKTKVIKKSSPRKPITKQAAKSKTKSGMAQANKKKTQTVQSQPKKTGRKARK